MADEAKKVSFGFAKSIKKSALKILPAQEEKKVDYIECLDEKSIKVVGVEEKSDGPLVIPLLGSKTWHDRILNKVDADIFETKTRDKENGNSAKITNGNARVSDNDTVPMDVSEIKKEKTDEAPRTLEEQAASEIIQDLFNKDVKMEDPNLEVPVTENETLRGEKESTLEDYEQIPIDVFGLAMLRGMGWKPGKGIGKNEKLVAAALPELRPRGMGLGADKVTQQKLTIQPKTKEEEQLKVEKGSFVKIIAGKHTNNYGQIEGFDDEAGRLIVKMALTGESQSLNEYLVEPVTKTEYTKNSKVLNAKKYEEYKNKGENKNRPEPRIVTLDSEQSSIDDDTKLRREDREKISRKKKKKSSKYTSDESTDSNERTRKRRITSDSEEEEEEKDEDYRHKRTKKSKKSRKRDSSNERSRKKSKKRNKERDKTRERKSEYAETSDRKKHKKHKRSRSRSTARR